MKLKYRGYAISLPMTKVIKSVLRQTAPLPQLAIGHSVHSRFLAFYGGGPISKLLILLRLCGRFFRQDGRSRCLEFTCEVSYVSAQLLIAFLPVELGCASTPRAFDAGAVLHGPSAKCVRLVGRQARTRGRRGLRRSLCRPSRFGSSDCLHPAAYFVWPLSTSTR